MERTRQLPPWQASFLLLSAIWGASFMFIKVGLEDLGPLEVAFARCAFGAVTLLALVALTRDRLPRGLRVWRDLFVVALFFNAVPFSLFSFGEEHVSSLVAGILNATTPLCTVLFVMALVPDELVTRERIGGLLVGFAGVLVVLGPWRTLGGGTVLGYVLCFTPALCYGFAFAYTRRHLIGRPDSFVSLSTAQVGLSVVQLAVVAPFFSSAPSHIAVKVWGSMIALGALGTGIAYLLNFDVIHRAGATTASSVTYVVPLFATIFGVTLLNERLTWNEPVGALVIIVGVAISQGLVRRATVPA